MANLLWTSSMSTNSVFYRQRQVQSASVSSEFCFILSFGKNLFLLNKYFRLNSPRAAAAAASRYISERWHHRCATPLSLGEIEKAHNLNHNLPTNNRPLSDKTNPEQFDVNVFGIHIYFSINEKCLQKYTDDCFSYHQQRDVECSHGY